MLCEICNVEEAAFTILPIGEGMPQSLGPACLARWVLQNCKDVLPAEEIAQLLGPMFVAGVVAEEINGPGQAESKQGRKSKAKREAPEGTTSGAVEIPATAENE